LPARILPSLGSSEDARLARIASGKCSDIFASPLGDLESYSSAP
jgi:hypothetical protein